MGALDLPRGCTVFCCEFQRPQVHMPMAAFFMSDETIVGKQMTGRSLSQSGMWNVSASEPD
jgi:hypothetical protein